MYKSTLTLTSLLLVAPLIISSSARVLGQNTVFGTGAGNSLTGSSATQNSFFGYNTGYSTKTIGSNSGVANSFIGNQAGYSNTTGNYNTFVGGQAGFNNTTGSSNLMLGVNAGLANTTGSANFFLGDNSGGQNTTGGYNVYIGLNSGNGAGVNGNNNVAIGFESGKFNNGGATNTFIGFRADASASNLVNATAIGANAKVTANNSLVLGNGVNVGIGVTAPVYKLTVAGTIAAREVNVTTEAWSDFVFDRQYRLPSLNEVETFIRHHKHLPEIPSAAEVESKGIKLGEMNAKLLQKIEELTLYIIAQQKRIEKLERKVCNRR